MIKLACIRAPQRRMKRRRLYASAALVLLAALSWAVPRAAWGQLIEQYYPSGIPGYQSWISDAVLDRPRSEYTPLGVRAGDFVIRPSLSEGFGYDSNVFGSTTPVGSTLALTQGNIAAQSDWSRNSLDVTLGFADQRDLQQSQLSHTDWNGGIGGTIDVGPDKVTLGYTHVTATTVPVDIGTLSVGQPITFSFDSAHVSYEAEFDRFSLQPAFEADIYDFATDITGASNSVATNNRATFTGSLAGGYALSPGRSLVLVLTGANADYSYKTPSRVLPNYTDVSLAGGLDVRTGALFRYRALIGYEERSFANSQLASTSSPLAELDVIWTPTRLTTVTAQVSRSLQNAIAAFQTETYSYTSGKLTVDHEYRRNVLLQAFCGLQMANFQTGGETQHVISAGASATWLINRRVSLTGRFSYTQSADNVNATLDQNDSVVALTLNFHL